MERLTHARGSPSESVTLFFFLPSTLSLCGSLASKTYPTSSSCKFPMNPILRLSFRYVLSPEPRIYCSLRAIRKSLRLDLRHRSPFHSLWRVRYVLLICHGQSISVERGWSDRFNNPAHTSRPQEWAWKSMPIVVEWYCNRARTGGVTPHEKLAFPTLLTFVREYAPFRHVAHRGRSAVRQIWFSSDLVHSLLT